MQSPSESQLERKEQARLLATELAERDQERRLDELSGGLLEIPQEVRFWILLFLDEGSDLVEYTCVAKQCSDDISQSSLYFERLERYKQRIKLLERAHDHIIERHNRLVERHNRLFVRIHGTSSVAAADAAPIDSDDSDSDSDVSDSDREERHLDREARRLERRCIRSELEIHEHDELRERFWLQHRSFIFLTLRKAKTLFQLLPDGEQKESYKENFKKAQNVSEEYFRERIQERS